MVGMRKDDFSKIFGRSFFNRISLVSPSSSTMSIVGFISSLIEMINMRGGSHGDKGKA